MIHLETSMAGRLPKEAVSSMLLPEAVTTDHPHRSDACSETNKGATYMQLGVGRRLAEAILRLILWDEGGIPVMGSSLDLSWLMEFSEMTCRGTSAMAGNLGWLLGPNGTNGKKSGLDYEEHFCGGKTSTSRERDDDGRVLEPNRLGLDGNEPVRCNIGVAAGLQMLQELRYGQEKFNRRWVKSDQERTKRVTEGSQPSLKGSNPPASPTNDTYLGVTRLPLLLLLLPPRSCSICEVRSTTRAPAPNPSQSNEPREREASTVVDDLSTHPPHPFLSVFPPHSTTASSSSSPNLCQNQKQDSQHPWASLTGGFVPSMAAVPTRTPGRGHPRYDISKRHANPGLQSKLNLDAEIRILLRDITASDKFNLRPSPFALLNYGNPASMHSVSSGPLRHCGLTNGSGPGRGITFINPSKTMQKKPLAISLAYADTTASSRDLTTDETSIIMFVQSGYAFFSRTILDLPGEGKIRFSCLCALVTNQFSASELDKTALQSSLSSRRRNDGLKARQVDFFVPLSDGINSRWPRTMLSIYPCYPIRQSGSAMLVAVHRHVGFCLSNPFRGGRNHLLQEDKETLSNFAKDGRDEGDSLSFTKHSQPNAGQWATRPPVVRNMLIRLFLFADRFMTSVSLRDRDLHRRIASATPLAISRSAKESGRRTDYEDGSPLAHHYPCPWSTMCLPCQVSNPQGWVPPRDDLLLSKATMQGQQTNEIFLKGGQRDIPFGPKRCLVGWLSSLTSAHLTCLVHARTADRAPSLIRQIYNSVVTRELLTSAALLYDVGFAYIVYTVFFPCCSGVGPFSPLILFPMRKGLVIINFHEPCHQPHVWQSNAAKTAMLLLRKGKVRYRTRVKNIQTTMPDVGGEWLLDGVPWYIDNYLRMKGQPESSSGQPSTPNCQLTDTYSSTFLTIFSGILVLTWVAKVSHRRGRIYSAEKPQVGQTLYLTWAEKRH
ncbi:hypothetical protein CCUS01_08267 [Colletotrichum cuscutae]|uniref:Uncharacterized protein n=1 Tax=Colletotrichum cuscutae TaxID=1209917 RepID=A0AAI9URX8_9PEZI|nr:hypothetical protein CCUS01_08267 [Colletotrichum cuscutae]